MEQYKGRTGLWEHAAGKTLDYIDLISLATGGGIDIHNEKLIRDIGKYWHAHQYATVGL